MMIKPLALVLLLVFLVVLTTVLTVKINTQPQIILQEVPARHLQPNLQSTEKEQKEDLAVPSYLLAGYALAPRRNVFFDLGANRGDSALQFTGLETYSDLQLQSSINLIPKRIPGPWEIIMYEASPRFNEQLAETKKRIEAITDTAKFGGPFKVTLYNQTAIGSQAGQVTFYVDVKSAVHWGSSLLKDHPDVKDGQMPITVPMHDLAREIMEKTRIQDYVIVKMDIEGIEYDLMFDLIVRGALPFIDELYVEYHGFAPDANGKGKCLNDYILPLAKKYGMKVGDWS